MSAIILRFPLRQRHEIRIERGRDGEGWLVLTQRGHAWAHGAFPAAVAPAREGGWYVLLQNGNGWLCGDRRQALKEFAALVEIEQVRS
jgi:hypothetical protein